MAIDVTATIIIECSSAEAAGYTFEPTNDPIWIGGITHATLLTERPIGKGTQVRRLARFMGKVVDYILEVTEFKEDNLMVMRSIKSPFPMVVTYRFDTISPMQTRGTIRVQGTAKGFYAITDFLAAPMVKRNITRDIKTLKKILEQPR